MIGLVFCGDLQYCPYLDRYLQRIATFNQKYIVYYWKRSNYDANYPANFKSFNHYSSLTKSKFQKLFDFLLFRRWLKKNIKMDSVDKIIVLSTLSGILIFDLLLSNKDKYIFDIRDYSYEHNKLFYFIEKKMIYSSNFTVISSKGFKKFLPDYEYIIGHNFNPKYLSKKKYIYIKHGYPISIVWNGVMRYFDFQKEYIDRLKNDSRFELYYYGDGPELDKYIRYCKANHINNVHFFGRYDNDEKEKILAKADFLNNCYGSKYNENETKYAISNKFYDGIIFHIPQIVEPNSFKSELVRKHCIGVSLPSDELFADKLAEYYYTLDENTFNSDCDKLVQEVKNEDDIYIEHIDYFIVS